MATTITPTTQRIFADRMADLLTCVARESSEGCRVRREVSMRTPRRPSYTPEDVSSEPKLLREGTSRRLNAGMLEEEADATVDGAHGNCAAATVSESAAEGARAAQARRIFEIRVHGQAL